MVRRPGDSAPMALMQLVEGPQPVAAGEPTETRKKSRRRAKAPVKSQAKSSEAASAEAPKKRTRKKKVAA